MSTNPKLQLAYDECVARDGRGHAVEMVEAAAGTWFLDQVPTDKIDATIAALSAKKATITAKASLKLVHANLNGMSQKIFRRNGRR